MARITKAGCEYREVCLKAIVAYFIANWLQTLVNIIELASLTALSLGKYCNMHIVRIER
jgi:hypothetical protein